RVKFILHLCTISIFIIILILFKLYKNDKKYLIIIKNLEGRNLIKKQNGINRRVFLLHEMYYFDDDPMFGNSTAVSILSGDVNFPNYNEILCHSSDGTVSQAKIELVAPLFIGENKCQWTVFRSECRVEKNSSYLYLSGKDNSKKSLDKVFLKKPEKAVDLAVCYGHSFMLDEWQSLVVAIELYKFFGASIQQLYWRSGRVEIYNLLKKYEKDGIIKLDLFGPTVSNELTEMLGFDIQLEISTRNYITAINDCFLKYRNAKFVLVIDSDELYIPRLGTNLIDELNYFSILNPHANSFVFERYDTFSNAYKNPLLFNIESTLMSMQISTHKRNLGKSVVIPSKTKGIHQHFGSYFKSNTNVVSIPSKLNYIVHNNKITLLNDNETIYFNTSKDKNSTIFYWLSIEKVNEINRLFNDRIKNTNSFKNLNSNYFYKNNLLTCKKELLERLWLRDDVCIENYDYCLFEKISNVSCLSAKINYKSYKLKDDLVMFKKTNTVEIYSSNGCTY
uniref:Glycosyltransferase family 92 protein n=2 Tax=Strongyloides stercoralis TaxID=6248 RepID=A0AAF5D332_STRER